MLRPHLSLCCVPLQFAITPLQLTTTEEDNAAIARIIFKHSTDIKMLSDNQTATREDVAELQDNDKLRAAELAELRAKDKERAAEVAELKKRINDAAEQHRGKITQKSVHVAATHAPLNVR